jgi:hypothetical protein
VSTALPDLAVCAATGWLTSVCARRDATAVRKAFSELQCDACLLVLEDLWHLLLHEPDPPAGEEPKMFEYSVIEKVHKMCGDPYNRDGPRGNVARWVGLHNIYNCTKDETGAANDGEACSGRENGKAFWMEREEHLDDVVARHADAVMTRAKDSDRAWHVGVYSMLCQKHLAPALPEIVEAFAGNGGRPSATLKDPKKRSSAEKAQQRVGATACELMCPDEARRKRKAKKRGGKKGASKTP